MSDTRVELQFTIPLQLREKLKRLQGLCAHRLKDPTSYAELFEILADLGLKELDPAKEPKRKSSAPNESVRQTSRYIPAPIRREVWRKSEGSCTYRDPKTDRPCASKFALQVDHLKPFARGGSSTDLANLTLLCRQHNLYRAVRSFGDIPSRPVHASDSRLRR